MHMSLAARAALAPVLFASLFELRARAQGTFVEPLTPSEYQVTVAGVPAKGGVRLWTVENFGNGPAISEAETIEVVRRCKEIAAEQPPTQVFPPSPAAFDLQFTVNAPPPGAAAAISSIETYYEGVFSTTHASGPIQLTVNFAPLAPTTAMSTGSNLYQFDNATLQSIISANVDSDDILQSFMPPSTIPVKFTFGGAVTNSTDFLMTAGTLVGTVPLVVVGVTPPHATVTVNTTVAWDYDPSNGVTAGQVCFRSAFAHEVGHALGFNSAISIPSPTIPTQLDIFRFRRSTDNATGFTDFKNHARLVHLDTPNDDHELSLVYAHYPMEDGNPQQASHFREQIPALGLMDPIINTGETFFPNYLQTSDLRVLDALGFDWNDPEFIATTSYRFDIEPNSAKSEATPAMTLSPGGTITGTSTGNSATAGDTTLASRDMFRVKTTALPLGIYRHTLTLTSATNGATASIRGLNQIAGVIGTADVLMQSSEPTGGITNTWYGFGKQEEIYYAVTGSVATTALYAATLSTSTVTATNIAGTFAAGSITVKSAVGQTTDSEIYIYDSNLVPVPLGHNDDPPSGNGPSLVTVNLAPGTYYVASSVFNTANNQSDLNPNEQFQAEIVLDFPNVLVNNNPTISTPVSYTVSDGITTTAVTATLTTKFEIQWGRFTVSGAPVSVCKGDGTGAPCPCGNTSTLLGAGCRSPFYSGAGATLVSTGTASIAADTLVLTANNIPGPCLFIQENLGSLVNFGDGQLCSSTAIVRMGVVFATSNVAVYPGGLTPAPIHIAGGASLGSTRIYQSWYRSNPSICNATLLYNLTQGVQLTWGP